MCRVTGIIMTGRTYLIMLSIQPSQLMSVACPYQAHGSGYIGCSAKPNGSIVFSAVGNCPAHARRKRSEDYWLFSANNEQRPQLFGVMAPRLIIQYDRGDGDDAPRGLRREAMPTIRELAAMTDQHLFNVWWWGQGTVQHWLVLRAAR